MRKLKKKKNTQLAYVIFIRFFPFVAIFPGFVAALPEKYESRRIYVEHIFHFTAAATAAASKTDGRRQLSSFRLIVGTLCIVRRRICCQDIAAGLLRLPLSNISAKLLR